MRGIKRDVSRRDVIKALGVSGVTLGGIGTGVTVATSNDDNDGTKKGCPNDLNIVYTRKHGKWRAHKRHDNEVNPKHIRVKGDTKKVKIYAPFPFAVSYATRKKKKDKKRDWDEDWKDDKKDGRKHDRKDDNKKDHDRHHRFKDCTKRKPVLAEPTDSSYCATIKADGKRKGKKKKKKICWFRIRCPKKKDDKHDRKDDWKDSKKRDRKDKKRDRKDKKRDRKDDKKRDRKDKEGC